MLNCRYNQRDFRPNIDESEGNVLSEKRKNFDPISAGMIMASKRDTANQRLPEQLMKELENVIYDEGWKTRSQLIEHMLAVYLFNTDGLAEAVIRTHRPIPQTRKLIRFDSQLADALASDESEEFCIQVPHEIMEAVDNKAKAEKKDRSQVIKKLLYLYAQGLIDIEKQRFNIWLVKD